MRWLNIFSDIKANWDNEYMWMAVKKKLRMKFCSFLVSCFNRIPTLTPRPNKFDDFVVQMKLFEAFENRENILLIIDANNGLKSQIMEQAERIFEHKFNLLGSGETYLGDKIDWYSDFKSGYRWEQEYYQSIEAKMANMEWHHTGADIKVPWELSRLQHLVILGQAYWLSCNEKYTQEFRDEVLTWIEDNPPEMGVNWVSSMDISLRAISLIIAYYYFRSSPIIEQKFWHRYFILLYNSGIHIEQNEEVSFKGVRNNHHLTNCAAMIWLSLFFQGYNRRTAKWLKSGTANIGKEMDYQVNSDGGSFEGSISYHRLATETLLLTTIIAEQNGLSFSFNYKKNLERMCEFSLNYTKQNGLAPQFGDADDSRFCVLSCYGNDEMRDHRSLLGVAGEYFQRNDFSDTAANKSLDRLWVFGNLEKCSNNPNTDLKLIKYPDTGFYIVRNKEVFFMVKCGRIGQKGRGGHDHNDQLSFELNIEGFDLIVDPGSYVYTMNKELRHLFRSTQYHNISQIGEFELNTIGSKTLKDIFQMHSSQPGICTRFDKSANNQVRFSGEITLANTEIQYERSVIMNLSKRQIEITDHFSDSKEECTCRLHLAKDAKVHHLNERSVQISIGDINAIIEAETVIMTLPGMLAPSYGIKYDSIILSWNFQHQTTFRIYY